jgi:hypothetical protein
VVPPPLADCTRDANARCYRTAGASVEACEPSRFRSAAWDPLKIGATSRACQRKREDNGAERETISRWGPGPMRIAGPLILCEGKAKKARPSAEDDQLT